jgi:hypothetical protein
VGIKPKNLTGPGVINTKAPADAYNILSIAARMLEVARRPVKWDIQTPQTKRARMTIGLMDNFSPNESVLRALNIQNPDIIIAIMKYCLAHRANAPPDFSFILPSPS